MQARRILAIVALAAAAVFAGVLWITGAGSSRSAALGSASETNGDVKQIDELLQIGKVELQPPRSSVGATPSADISRDRNGGTPAPHSAGSSGSVRGRVIDQDGVGVAWAKVSLYRGQAKAETVTDPRGGFAFDGLESGVCRLYVDARSLPDGFLPPWRQQVPREATGNPTGIFGTALRLANGEEREVDLRVFAAGSVSGRLVGPLGEPIENSLVSICSSVGVTHSTRTDAGGFFAMANVYPGSYSTIVKLGAERAGLAASSPLPIRFELEAGERRVLPDLQAGVGGHILRGSIVDEAGRPVAGLSVVCEEAMHSVPGSRWETVTDDAGRFELGRVPSAELVVTVGLDECSKPEGLARISKRVAPIAVDARAEADVLDLGVVEVEASHPFRLVGRVRVDPAWAEANRFERWTVRVDGREFGEPRSRNVVSEFSAARPDRHSLGEFTWGCATPHAPIELTVVLRDVQGVEHERSQIVHPTADTTREVLVAFP
jgi:hypothetical protein